MGITVIDWRATTASKNTICLWYDGTAEDAARFYAQTFPDSTVSAIHRAPGGYPDGKQGDVLSDSMSDRLKLTAVPRH